MEMEILIIHNKMIQIFLMFLWIKEEEIVNIMMDKDNIFKLIIDIIDYLNFAIKKFIIIYLYKIILINI